MLTTEHWPLQSECDTFYGNPRGADGNQSEEWKRANLAYIVPPYKVMFGHITMSRLVIHKKCAESALRILNAAWEKIGKRQETADAIGISAYSGSNNFRPIRGGKRLSMHAYACAWDWDAPHNPLGSWEPRFHEDNPLVAAHLEEGWTWGFDWNRNHKRDEDRPDAMHFQAARVN